MKKPEVPQAKPSRTHRRFDRAFKEEAVNSWINAGMPGSVIAEELGIPANNLCKWRKAFNRQPETLTGRLALPALDRRAAARLRLFVVGKVCLMVCLFGISCRTFKSDSTTARNVKQITREEVRLSIEGPHTLTTAADGILRIEIENLRMESIKLYPALNFVAKLRGASGLVPPKMQHGKIAVLGTETPPESTAEAAAFHTTVGKQLVVIKPGKTYQLEVDVNKYSRLDRGNYRFEATVNVVFLSPDDDPRMQRGVRLKPESLEFSVAR